MTFITNYLFIYLIFKSCVYAYIPVQLTILNLEKKKMKKLPPQFRLDLYDRVSIQIALFKHTNCLETYLYL